MRTCVHVSPLAWYSEIGFWFAFLRLSSFLGIGAGGWLFCAFISLFICEYIHSLTCTHTCVCVCVWSSPQRVKDKSMRKINFDQFVSAIELCAAGRGNLQPLFNNSFCGCKTDYCKYCECIGCLDSPDESRQRTFFLYTATEDLNYLRYPRD